MSTSNEYIHEILRNDVQQYHLIVAFHNETIIIGLSLAIIFTYLFLIIRM